MRSVYKLYKVDFIRNSDSEISIEATSRRGLVYIATLRRSDERYWEGGSDFGWSIKKKFKAIIQEFFQNLVQEVKEYDSRWYTFKCVVRMTDGGETRPLTWDETEYRRVPEGDKEPEFNYGI
jgi:hypothetical protein